MYLRNCWYVAGWDMDLAPEGFLTISILDEPILIYRTKQDGVLVALEDRCCHRFAPLSKGRIEDGCNVRCLYHGLKFAPSGVCIEIPGQDKIPTNATVRAYPVVAKHSWIWVWMGDTDKYDEELIPPAIGYDDPDYILRHGNMDYAANYQLVNDNLTDFSHLSYVHAESFGATEHWARSRPAIKVIDRGIRVSRWIGPEEEGLKADSPTVVRSGTSEPMALYSTYDYLAPGVLLMKSGVYRPEDMPEDRTQPPTAPAISENFTSQAVTPMGDRSTRYFFSWGPTRRTGNAEMADGMRALAERAFTEDREMIEAQQATIDKRPGHEMLTSADIGPVQMRGVLRKLIKAEQTDSAYKD